MEKLKDLSTAKVFQAQVGGKFAALNIINSNVNNLVDDIKEVLVMPAEYVLGDKERSSSPGSSMRFSISVMIEGP